MNQPGVRAKGTGSPEVKPVPSGRGLGAGAAGSPAAGGAPTIAGLRVVAGLDVLREALEVLAHVVRVRGDTYIKNATAVDSRDQG